MKHFISVHDVTNVNDMVQLAMHYKQHPFIDQHLGANKRIGLLFLNPSLRTRLSTQIAASNLGMEAIVFNIDKDGWALEFEEGAIMSGHTVEHIKDAAPILGQYFDILCIRAFPALQNKQDDYSEQVMKAFMQYAAVPIVSLESATLHPLQSLTDVLTIKEHWHKPTKPKVVLTWAPHIKALPQCVANSFSQWMTHWGEAEFVIAHPEDYALDATFTKSATITHHQDEALQNADFVYVKNWSTYHDYGKIYSNDPSWMLTEQKLQLTNQAKVMHCLPVRRNIELSDEILDSNASLVNTQAGNRVWAAQAVLSTILKTL
ncbi:N-acetylornithine carbamoyltransferase [Ferruginibacter yonginensis]|uniref:N-succinylornithine carbamoyltransferase n=1 Tax=Ferruginibacter yonginensis TaxID=1310416 RepID=A0ABV8QW85_9BACT